MKTLLQFRARLTLSTIILAAALIASHARAQVISSTWLGDGTGNFNDGNWSNSSLWNPHQVPNNAGPTVYDVTIPFYDIPGGQGFNGPKLDVDTTVRNLTLVNRVFLDTQGTGSSLEVTGTTASTTAPGHDGEYAAIFTSGGTFRLGTLANYDAGTHTFNGLFVFPINNTTIGFRNADIWRNNGTIIIGNASAHFVDQDTNQNAIRNLAVNDGGLTIGSGINFTTAGNFTNNSGMTLESTDGSNTLFTVSGNFTNFDAGTKTLTGGNLDVEVRDTPGGTAVFRFANADIRNINGTTIKLVGAGAAITDLAGQNALRNLSGINGGNLTSAGTLTITPAGGTFTNSGSTHTIDNGANVTIQGNHQIMNGGSLHIGAPTSTSNTQVTITGHMSLDGGGLDMGGQPGVNTQYHTQLQVMNGIEFRGAYLTGTGTTFADVGLIQGSVFSPHGSTGSGARPATPSIMRPQIQAVAAPADDSPIGQQTIEGAVMFDNTAQLMFDIGGTTAGEEYDQLVQHGTASCTIGGSLSVTLVNGFENSIQHSDVFDVITSDRTLAGTFEGLNSGDRIMTTDGNGSFRVTYAGQKTVTLDEFQPTLKLVSVVSRATHGAKGDFDLPIDTTGNSITVEPRALGTPHLVFTFNNNISGADVSVDAPHGADVLSVSVDGQTVEVTLTGVSNAQIVTVNLDNIVDEYLEALAPASFSMGFLIGDVNGDGYENAADATITRNRSGMPADATTYLEDVNLDGTVNAADATQVRARSGTSIFPPTKPSRAR